MKKMLQSLTIITSLFYVTLVKKCDQEHGAKQEVVRNEKMTVKRLSGDELRKVSHVAKKLNEVLLALVTDAYNADNRLIVNRDEALFIKERGTTSYTFPIIRKYPSDTIENLVLNFTEKGDCNVFLTKYQLKRNQVLQRRNLYSLEDKMTIAIRKKVDKTSREQNLFYTCNILAKVPIVWNDNGEVTSSLEWLQKQVCEERYGLDGKQYKNSRNATAPVLQILTTPVVSVTFTSFLKKFKAEITAVHPNSIWWRTNASDAVVAYLKEQFDLETGLENREANDFALWAVNYMCKNPEITWEHLKNWFLTPEGISAQGYDCQFWKKTMQKFRTRRLPSYRAFVQAVPQPKEYHRIDGSVVKVNPEEYSYDSTNGKACQKENRMDKLPLGADCRNTDISVKDFNSWMKKTYGRPTYRLKGAKANCREAIAKFLNGKTGIYTLVNTDVNQDGVSGHVDLITKGKCLTGAGVCLQKEIQRIEIWELN